MFFSSSTSIIRSQYLTRSLILYYSRHFTKSNHLLAAQKAKNSKDIWDVDEVPVNGFGADRDPRKRPESGTLDG